MCGGVNVADKAFRWLDTISDTIKPGGQRRCESQVWIAVGTRNTALYPQARAAAYHPKARRAVVIAPRKPRWRPGTVDKAFVGIHSRGVERHYVGHMFDPSAQEPAENVGAFYGTKLLVAVEDILALFHKLMWIWLLEPA